MQRALQKRTFWHGASETVTMGTFLTFTSMTGAESATWGPVLSAGAALGLGTALGFGTSLGFGISAAEGAAVFWFTEIDPLTSKPPLPVAARRQT